MKVTITIECNSEKEIEEILKKFGFSKGTATDPGLKKKEPRDETEERITEDEAQEAEEEMTEEKVEEEPEEKKEFTGKYQKDYEKIVQIILKKGPMRVKELHEYFTNQDYRWVMNRVTNLVRQKRLTKDGRIYAAARNELEEEPKQIKKNITENTAENIQPGQICPYCNNVIFGLVKVIKTEKGWMHKKCFDKMVEEDSEKLGVEVDES